MTISDNTEQAEILGDFFKSVGNKGLNVSKKMAINLLKNPRRALEIGANLVAAFASQRPKTALSSLPEMINFHQRRKGSYLGKLL